MFGWMQLRSVYLRYFFNQTVWQVDQSDEPQTRGHLYRTFDVTRIAYHGKVKIFSYQFSWNMSEAKFKN